MKTINQNIANACSSFGLQVDCLASGPDTATVAIVSDYPGETEKQTKLPFSGKSGRYLWSILKPLGLTRTNVYTTNVIKRVSTNNTKIKPDELSLYKEVLEIELGSLPNLKYILCLGSSALHALVMPRGNISSWRGSVMTWNHTQTFHSFNPAYVIEEDNRTGEFVDPIREVIFKLDISKFKRLLAGQYAPDRIETNVCDTYERFRECLEYLEKRSTDNPICIDIEHLRKQTSCIGFSAGEDIGWVIPFFTTDANIFSLEDELRIKHTLSKFIRSPETRILGQYVSTDLSWLWFKDGIGPVSRIWGDTLLAHHALHPGLPHSLGFMTSQYTWNPFYKDEGHEWRLTDNIQQYWEYNAKDTVNTFNIHEVLLKQLARVNALDLYQNHIMRLTHHLCNATVIGVPLDMNMKARLEEEFIKKLEEKKTFIGDIAASFVPEGGIDGKPFNVGSSAQVGRVLHDYMGAPVLARKTTSGKYKVGKEQLKALFDSRVTDEMTKTFCEALLDYRADAKFFSTYVKVRTDEDNRFRTFYTQTGVKSAPGRLSSKETQWGSGSNIQNQPEASRQMFVAPEGWCFVYIDGSQAEARYVGWRAKIWSWIEDFEKARLNPGTFDCHRALASVIFGVPYDEVPEKDFIDGAYTIRYYGKRARHGLNYRMMPQTFSIKAGIPLYTATNIYNKYHAITPELKKWWAEVENIIRTTKKELGYGLLTNPWGRRLTFPQRLTTGAIDSMVAFEPQSSIGDLLEETWYKSHEDDDWPMHSARILIDVHDSLTALSKIEHAKTCARILVKHAERPIILNNGTPPLIIPAEAKISVPDEHGIHRWSNLKSVIL